MNTPRLHFVKMHGCGNDYVYLDAVTAPALAERADLPELARRIADRHTGVGGDGLILVCRATAEAPGAHVRMRMFNADGSESEMCGNGVRCVAKFAHDRLGVRPTDGIINIQTGRGVLAIRVHTRPDAHGRESLIAATVDMGEPILDLARVPVDASRVRAVGGGEFSLPCPSQNASDQHPHQHCRGVESLRFVFVSMGNPHATAFVSSDAEQSAFWPDTLFPTSLETHPAFPNRANIHLARVLANDRIRMKTWERGSGFTRACGTGACAVLVSAVLTGRADRGAVIEVPGGELLIEWDAHTNHVRMTGEAVECFEGEWCGADFRLDTPPSR